MSIPSPYKNPDAYGFVTVGGTRLPGILTAIELPERTYEFTIQQGYGQGKVTIYKSIDLLDGITVTHFLRSGATPNDRDDFDILRDDFMPFLIPGWPNKLTAKPRAFPFVHPEAQWLGLKRAHLKAFACPKMANPGDPSRWYKMTFQEDVPQQKIPVGKPEPAKLKGPPAPKDALEATVSKALEAFTSGDGLTSIFGGG